MKVFTPSNRLEKSGFLLPSPSLRASNGYLRQTSRPTPQNDARSHATLFRGSVIGRSGQTKDVLLVPEETRQPLDRQEVRWKCSTDFSFRSVATIKQFNISSVHGSHCYDLSPPQRSSGVGKGVRGRRRTPRNDSRPAVDAIEAEPAWEGGAVEVRFEATAPLCRRFWRSAWESSTPGRTTFSSRSLK